MKKTDWYRAISLADDKYVAEADPNNIIRPKRNKVLISLIAACACFALLLCNLWLFIPYDTDPPDVSRYKNSEYYGIIQKLNVLTYQKPKYKNNADKLLAFTNRFFNDVAKDMAEGTLDAPTYGPPEGSSDEYHEITDNQVEGIIEADRIKRSDKYIYYLDHEVLRVYSIDKENTKEV